MKQMLQRTETKFLSMLAKTANVHIRSRFWALFAAAKFVQARQKTDPVEYHGFLAGLTHSLQVINDELL